MAKNALVVAGPKLQKALHDLVGTSPKTDLTAAHTPQKAQSVITRMGGESKSPSYNGYFTIKDVSTYNEDGTIKEFRIAVCDGETWDPETETSRSPMTAYVNNMSVTIESVVFTLTYRKSAYWHIKLYVVDRRKYPDSVLYPLVDSDYMALMLFVYDAYDRSTREPDNYASYLIGEIHDVYGLIQRHISGIGNGIPRIWIEQNVCTMETEDDINPNV